QRHPAAPERRPARARHWRPARGWRGSPPQSSPASLSLPAAAARTAPAALVATVAALATRNSEFYAGRVFDADAVRRMRPALQPMAWPWLRVVELAAERGTTLLTADQVTDPRDVHLIAYDWTPDA